MSLGVWLIASIQKRQIPYRGLNLGKSSPHLALELKDGEVLCVKAVTEPDTIMPVPSRHWFSC